MKTKILLILLFTISACGMGRPMPPTIATWGGQGYFPYDTSNSGYGATAYSLEMVTLFWDVSDVPGAIGVDLILAKHNSCEKDVLFSRMVSNIKTGTTFNPINNLASLYGTNYIEPDLYFICLKVRKLNGSKSPASWPVYLNITNPYFAW